MGLPVVTYRLAGSLPPVAVRGVAMRLQPITVQPAHKADQILGGFPATDTPPRFLTRIASDQITSSIR
jgi:hypothetical protein